MLLLSPISPNFKQIFFYMYIVTKTTFENIKMSPRKLPDQHKFFYGSGSSILVPCGSGSRGPNLCGSGRIRIRNTGIRNTADDTTSFISSLSLSSILRIVADPHKFFTDPDPAFYFHVHPDPDPGF